MATLFTKILEHQLPGHFVYEDDKCGALLSIAPLRPGHLLVVPRREVDHWLDLEAEEAAHLFAVAQRLGRVLQETFQPRKVGLMIAGLEIPHAHLHLVPIESEADLDFANARPASAEELAQVAARIREHLK